MEDEKLDLRPNKASLNVKSKKNFRTYSRKGTRGRKAPKDLTKKAPLQTEASKKNFKTYQKKGTRGRNEPEDLTEKETLQYAAAYLAKLNLLKEEIKGVEIKSVKSVSPSVKSVSPFFDKAWEDHSNCSDGRAEEEDSDSPEPSDDEWKPIWPSPAPMYPLCKNGFPPFRFA